MIRPSLIIASTDRKQMLAPLVWVVKMFGKGLALLGKCCGVLRQPCLILLFPPPAMQYQEILNKATSHLFKRGESHFHTV